MANITPINGSMKLPQAWPIIDDNIRKVNADITSHKTDVKAHKAEHIEVSNVSGVSNVAGAISKVNVDIAEHKASNKAHIAEHIEVDNVNGASNVAEAFDVQRERIDNLVVNSGTDIAEVIDARGDFVILRERLNAGDMELASLRNFLGYMPINGGGFDGNDPAGPIIDGGTY